MEADILTVGTEAVARAEAVAITPGRRGEAPDRVRFRAHRDPRTYEGVWLRMEDGRIYHLLSSSVASDREWFEVEGFARLLAHHRR